MLPPKTSEFLFAGGTWRLPGSTDVKCEGARFHSPTPIFTHEVRLIPREWDAEISALHSPRAMVCGTCRDNLVILQQMLAATEGHLDWEIRREFGNDLRGLAMRGWEEFARLRPDQPQTTQRHGKG